MGNHFDAEMADIVVIVSKSYGGRFDDALAELVAIGLAVAETDRDEGVIEGTIDAARLAELQKLACVNYVRTVMTYVADFPTGDARDLDGNEEESA